MQKKLQELTEKIYQEGVEKANKEAEQILKEAKKEAKELLEKAKKEADSEKEAAKKEAEEIRQKGLNELRLSARQAISDLKQEITDLIQAKTIGPEAKKTLQDTGFTGDIIKTIVKNWNPEESDTVDLYVLLPKDRKKEFESYFQNKAKELLEKGLKLDFSDKLKDGFKIGPKDGGYLISFSDDDFDSFFRMYLRPRLIEMLFEEGKKQDKESKAKESKGK